MSTRHALPLAGERVTAADLQPWDLIEHDGYALVVESVAPEPADREAVRLWVNREWTEHPPLTLPADAKVTLAGDRIEPDEYRP